MKTRSLALITVSLLLISCTKTPIAEERKEKMPAVETGVTSKALERKTRSENRLRTEGVQLNASLPAIEEESDTVIRRQAEVAHRAMALLVVALKGQGLEQGAVKTLVKDYALAQRFTPKEIAFINNSAPSDHERLQFAWRYEAAWTLLWSLGYVDVLSKPAEVCDVTRAVKFLKDRSAQQFQSDAKLRSSAEILDQADLIYRYHWAVVDARLNGRQESAALEPGVTMERHHALNWLINYMEQDWDDVSTGT